jgi:hypothetical protein
MPEFLDVTGGFPAGVRAQKSVRLAQGIDLQEILVTARCGRPFHIVGSHFAMQMFLRRTTLLHIIALIGCRVSTPQHVSSTLLQRWIKPEQRVRAFFRPGCARNVRIL